MAIAAARLWPAAGNHWTRSSGRAGAAFTPPQLHDPLAEIVRHDGPHELLVTGEISVGNQRVITRWASGHCPSSAAVGLRVSAVPVGQASDHSVLGFCFRFARVAGSLMCPTATTAPGT